MCVLVNFYALLFWSDLIGGSSLVFNVLGFLILVFSTWGNPNRFHGFFYFWLFPSVFLELSTMIWRDDESLNFAFFFFFD